jgi:hypothetical protein
MFRSIFRAIAAALAALPKFVVTVCRTTGRFIAELIPSSALMTTSAGLEADDLLQEIRQAAQEAELFKMDRPRVLLAWAAAVAHGYAPPDVSRESEAFQGWLADLDESACRKIMKCTMKEIERHMAPRGPGDHLFGVPSWGDRPEKAAPVGHGSHSTNAKAVQQATAAWDDILNGLEHA